MSMPVEIGNPDGGVHRRPSADSRSGEGEGDYGAGSGSASNLTFSLSRSVEMSCALRSRSPWIVSASPMEDSLNRAQDRMSQARDRSNSYASRITISTQGDDASIFAGSRRGGDSASMRDRDAIRNLDDFDDANRGLPDEGRGLIADQDSSRSVFSRDGHGEPDGSLSTFAQTLFNSVNMLMGVGLLSLPYAMRLAGWFGMFVVIFCSVLTCYTAKILGRIQEYVPSKKLREGPGAYTIYGFHDMGELVFGEYGKIFISAIFILETFGYCCVYLIIEGENLSHQLGDVPYFSSWGKPEFMTFSALIFLPSCLLRNLSWLSYFSAIGVFSSLFLLFGVVATGMIDNVPPNPDYCASPSCTGSLYKPSPTDNIHIDHTLEMAGLVMVGFAGHAVFPTLRNDMVDKTQYSRMVEVTYCIACSAYILMAAVGYIMFGNSAQPEVTENLSTKNWVSRVIIWVVIVNPVTKFALDLAPIALALESYVAISFKVPQRGVFYTLLSCIVRILLVGLALIIVISAPSFATVLAVLGSLCSFTISLAFPCWCYVRLFWNQLGWPERILNIFGAILGSFFAVAGTIAALMGGPAHV